MYCDSICIFSIIQKNELSSIGSSLLWNHSGGCPYNVLAFDALCGETRHQDGRETDEEIIVIKRNCSYIRCTDIKAKIYWKSFLVMGFFYEKLLRNYCPAIITNNSFMKGDAR